MRYNEVVRLRRRSVDFVDLWLKLRTSGHGRSFTSFLDGGLVWMYDAEGSSVHLVAASAFRLINT